MNTYLLYAHKDWVNVENYFDHQSIVQDLGLKTLFSAAAKGVVKENGEVKTITDAQRMVKQSQFGLAVGTGLKHDF